VVIIGLHAIADAAEVRTIVERLGCPVLTTYQAVGVLPEGHPQLAGLYTSGAIESAVLDAADVVLAIGFDSVEPMPSRWRAAAEIVSVSPIPPASTFLPTSVELVGPLVELLGEICRGHMPSVDPALGAAELAAARARLRTASSATFGPIELVDALIEAAPDDATVTVDAGAHFLAVMPFWPVRSPLQLLISNGLATMGFAVPAAIGAAFARPGQPVLACVGDGGLGMTLAELETIARYDLPITVVVFNDAALSLIEIKQRAGQGGEGAVRYRTTDFAAAARAMGLDARTATTAADVADALRTGWDRPRLVDARIDPFPYAELIRITRG
jgi:acetolactate synthase I/II/III large subunit